MKNVTKFLCFALAVLMVVGMLASCKPNTENPTPSDGTKASFKDPYESVKDDHLKLSDAVYNDVLGEFNTLYSEAKAADSNSMRFALMALAEAKLLQAGVLVPTTANGGNYAIGNVAPNTTDYSLWGSDEYRYPTVLVVNEKLKASDRAAMKAHWTEVKGTGTYLAWAKQYLLDHGYTLKDTYSKGYSSEPDTWDVLASSKQVVSEPLVNTFSGLMEYDCEGVLQPALAESYTVEEYRYTVQVPDIGSDGEELETTHEEERIGQKYIFKIRKGVIWVDSQGRKVADVKADDFVAGMQHSLDAGAGLEYLVEGIIMGIADYNNGTNTNFADTGVKALDDYTLEYTLEAPCSYFTTMLGYSIFAPMSRSYYASQGGKFGTEFDASAETYKYGMDKDHIAYNGPFLISNYTEKNTIVFTKNDSYWDKDNVTVKSITWLFNDGQDSLKGYNDYKAGVIDATGLNASAVEQAKKDGLFDEYHYIVLPDASTFCAFFNLYRQGFANARDSKECVSSQTDEMKTRTKAAMLNVHFRRAIGYAFNRSAYNEQAVGTELKNISLLNSFVPGNFVSLEEDITVKINGKDTMFKKGTFYGVILQAQLDADGSHIKAWNPEADDGAGASTGYDGWYNVDAAVSELNLAIEDLAKQGVKVSKENPIHLDWPVNKAVDITVNRCNVVKQSIENALGGKVIIDLTECNDRAAYLYAGYYPETGKDENYNIYDVSGWGPDFGDPSTYLDNFAPNGYMLKSLGIY